MMWYHRSELRFRVATLDGDREEAGYDGPTTKME